MTRPWRKFRLRTDAQVLSGPLVYYGAVLKATNAGAATLDIYDGTSTAGEWSDALTAGANAVAEAINPAGVRMERGIYGDLGSNVDLAVVFYHLPSDIEGLGA